MINMKISLYIFCLFCLISLGSCSSDDPFDVASGNPVLLELSPVTSFLADTLTIKGEYLGEKASGNFVCFGTSITVPAENCPVWNNSFIKVVVPPGVSGSTAISVQVGSYKTNTLTIAIDAFEPYSTVLLAGGNFTMGSVNGLADEQPLRTVNLTQFEIGACEVNQRLYSSIMGKNPSQVVNVDFPVYNVEWIDAVKFCNKLSELSNLEKAYQINGNEVTWNKSAKGWRLPTEAEWEYACRAGSNSDYCSDDCLDYAWLANNSGYNPQAIKTKKANAYGLFDMQGNASEWCWDNYSENYYGLNENDNPSGPISGLRRVIRGGNFAEGKLYARASNRSISENTSKYVGIRLVRNK